jgi:hypothetical protein
METEQQIWQAWVDALRRRKMSSFVALILEAGGPLNLIAAQLVYLGQPLLGSTGSLQALAHLLEDTEQTQFFVTNLREGTPR